MAERCWDIQSRYDIVHCDIGPVSLTCLREDGHVGPHLVKRVDWVGGKYVLWIDHKCDWGTCSNCDGEDPLDNCLAFCVISVTEAQKYIDDPKKE